MEQTAADVRREPPGGGAAPAGAPGLAVEHERARLAALARYRVLDTPNEGAFDDLTALAAQLCGVSMALVSLVDADRQWFKARLGIEVCSTDREVAFCAHALAAHEVLVVPDATLDPRFADNPFVTGEAHIRFYAGAPLITPEGHVLGTLCVMDTEPRRLTGSQVRLLAALARQVMTQLEHRRQADALAAEVAGHEVARAGLARTRSVLDGVLAHTDVVVSAKDRDGRYLLANEALHALLPDDGQQVLGRTDFDLFDRATAASHRRHDVQVELTGRQLRVEETAAHRDGTDHSYLSTRFPLLAPDGHVYAVAGVSADVTELAVTRRALGASEQRWRALVERSPVAVAVYGAADLRFRYANDRAAQVYGAADAAQLIGRSYLDVIPEELRDDYRRSVAAIVTGADAVLGRETILVGFDGRRRHVEVNAALVTFDGEPALQVELRDITARVTADEALRASEERFRALFTSAPVGVVEALPDGTLLAVNPQLCDMLGYAAEELVGRPAGVLTAPDERERQSRDLASQSEGAKGWASQRIYQRKDGSLLPVLVSAGVVRDRQGVSQRVVGMVVDVSAQAEAQQALLVAHAQLAERHAFTDAVLEAVGVGIVACDADGRLTVFNSATRSFHGVDADAALDPAELPGRYDLMEADGTTPLPADRIPLLRALHEGSVSNAEIVIRPQGRPAVRVLVSGHALSGPDGSSLGAVVAMHDVTELRQRETELQEALAAIAIRKAFDEAVLETVNAGVLACDADGHVVVRNAAQRRLTGETSDEPKQVGSLQPAPDRSVLRPDGSTLPLDRYPLHRALAGEELVDLPLRVGPAGGELHDVLVTARQIRLEDGTLLGAVAAHTDVTGERRVQAQLRESAAFHDAVLAASPDLIYVVDPHTNISIWASRNLHEMLGYTEEQVRALGSGVVAALVHPQDISRLVAANTDAQALADGEVLQTRYRAKDAGGKYRWLARRVTPFARDADGHVTQTLGIARDITENVEVEDRLAEAALHDPLTGLPNRRLLADRLRSALARGARNGHQVAVLFCDLDGFKNVNDTSGHAAGDTVLKIVAERLSAVLRPQDTVARVGGDEFVVLIEPASGGQAAVARAGDRVHAAALVVTERVKRALAEPMDLAGVTHVVTASIGLTLACATSDAEEVLRDADAAMYRAKSRGKNRYELFDRELRADAAERGRVEGVLRSALQLGGAAAAPGTPPLRHRGTHPVLTVAYQPIVDLDSARVVGVEALARLRDEQRLDIPPVVFIPIAEATGMIGALGRRVLDLACEDLATWHARYPSWRHLGMSVNLSAKQVGLADLVDQVQAVLRRTGLSADLLTLELTESVLLEAGRSAISALHALRDLGVQIAIDDFGTGYASLRYLAQLPVTSVKVDRSFTSGLPHDVTSSTIVRAVTGLARDLRLGCVVEGIETEEQLRALPAGVRGQGYLLGRPVDARALDALLCATAEGQQTEPRRVSSSG